MRGQSLSSLADLVDLRSERYAWRAFGACRGSDVNFFPERGESTAPAKALCSECPVQAICAEVALANGEHHGIWGGLSERERRRIRKQRSGNAA